LCGNITKSVNRTLKQANAEYGRKEENIDAPAEENTVPGTSSLFAKYRKKNINIEVYINVSLK